MQHQRPYFQERPYTPRPYATIADRGTSGDEDIPLWNDGELVTPTSRQQQQQRRPRPYRSTISSVLAQARATVEQPSRPFTPRDHARGMFNDGEYTIRPQTAFSISSSLLQDQKLQPLQPSRDMKRVDTPHTSQKRVSSNAFCRRLEGKIPLNMFIF